MILSRALATCVLLCALTAPSHAQSTKAFINSQITNLFPDQNVGQITPLSLRTVTSNIINSIMPTAPVVSGNLACFNGTTGLLQDCGVSPTTPGLTVGVSTISGGTSTRILYDNAGVLGEYAVGAGVATALGNGINTAGGTVVPTSALTANGVVYGGGSGVTPASTAAGTSGQLFLGVTSAAPQWGTMGGDATIGNTGTLTLASVNANTGPFGSATQCVTVTNNAKGLTTAVSATTCTPAIGSITGLGTGVATAAGTALSANGGLTTTIASGATAMGTGAISSGACASAVTATATNTATTDVVLASFNGDPTAITGYVPSSSGMLTIIVYPTLNTANFKVCNNTTSIITPSAVTLNWRVVR